MTRRDLFKRAMGMLAAVPFAGKALAEPCPEPLAWRMTYRNADWTWEEYPYVIWAFSASKAIEYGPALSLDGVVYKEIEPIDHDGPSCARFLIDYRLGGACRANLARCLPEENT